MPDPLFTVESAQAVPHAVAPLLAFQVRVTNAVRDEVIHAIVLSCQIRIEPAARRYAPDEQAALSDLFGEPTRWGQTLHSFLWTHAHVSVPSFRGEVLVDLPAPCSFDFNVAATKYFHALGDGEVSLRFLFRGTIFHEAADGSPRVALISHDREASFRLPVRIWQETRDHYYPNSAWVNLRRDVFDRLHRFKVSRGLATWERALEVLLAETGAAP